jgi:predicted ATPase
MLREFRVSGYRSLRQIALELSPLTVVVGVNGAGKTNLYRCLHLLACAAQGTLAQAMAAEGGLPSAMWAGPRRKHESPRIELWIDLGDLVYELQVGVIPPPQGPFSLDPDVKEEHLWVADAGKQHLVAERRAGSAFARDGDGRRVSFPFELWGAESALAQIVEPQRFPLLSELRARLLRWRFYHSFRTDAEAPVRQSQVGVRTPALAHDGRDLAAALMTIHDVGDRTALHEAVSQAFPGAELELIARDGHFSFQLRMPGLLRPLEPAEVSDGTLRFLLLLAVLLSPRPPPFLALNEPETSLHPETLPPVANLIGAASRRGQIFVVTHSEALADLLEKSAGATARLLQKRDGATTLC